MATAVPALVASVLPLTLIASGAPTSPPDISLAIARLGNAGWQEFGVLLLTVLALGIVLHPLHFGFTQVLEGYWGNSPRSVRAMRRSACQHLAAAASAEQRALLNEWDVSDCDQKLSYLTELEKQRASKGEHVEKKILLFNRWRARVTAGSLHARMQYQENARFRSRYPEDLAEVMPTRLGNMLRRHERLAGKAFGVDAVVVTPFLAQLVDDTLRDYYDDARTDLDLASHMVLAWLLTSAVCVALLWPHNVWLLLPCGTALLAGLSYRGAVHAAEAYGEALAVLVALGRNQLYAALGLVQPVDGRQELEQNVLLMQQLMGEAAPDIAYREHEYHGQAEPE